MKPRVNSIKGARTPSRVLSRALSSSVCGSVPGSALRPVSGSLLTLPAAARALHSSRSLAKNPYYFYDLASKQPTGNLDEMEQRVGHYMFDPSINASQETMSERVQKVFGSLGSRDASTESSEAQTVTVLGIKVPPRPEEPTNCCMSGCINCVWELYKDELQDWRDRVQQARTKLMDPAALDRPWPHVLGKQPEERRQARAAAGYKDAAGLDSQDGQAGPDEEPSGINQGINVFIETEKRLKQRRAQRAQAREQQASSAPTSTH